ncbi:DUF222 domain-containing protein [Williamsia sp. 1138]|uniref:DUF222 domain-containing protein n=1 Tax=Williamsia sp. 1138 TaxID=1903117 RepID=UPI001FEF9AA5|nr:DUF222 domain-containing protein [Williamsia sp. 1138]
MFECGDVEVQRVAGIGPANWLRPNELLRNCERSVTAQSYFEWVRYDSAAQLHRQVVAPLENTPVALRAVDPFAVCAAQLAAAQQITQQGAEHYLTRALALRDRLPHVKQLLKEGQVAAHHIAEIVSRTDLIDGSEYMADIDRDIAAQLRRRGSWSKNRIRDMVDAMIMLRDPDLVRENRADAKKRRGVWNNNIGDGMSALDAVGSAESNGLIMQRLEKLAMSVCKADPRRKSERMSDALFATVMGREFACECPKDPKHPCSANIWTWPADMVVSGIDATLVLHVIADQATIDGDADNPGYLQGHGVISGEHVRDIAGRPETKQRPMRNDYEQSQPPWNDHDLRAEAEYADLYAQDQAAAAAADKAAAVTTEAAATDHDPETEPKPAGNPEADRAAGPEAQADPETTSESETDGKTQTSSPPAAAPDRDRGPTRATVYSRAPEPPRYDEMVAEAAAPPYWQAVPLPVVQPGDSYRPSTVLDDFIRMRDLYCVWPGCNKPAWTADLDHTCEYNHHDPDNGGHTHPDGMKALCRFHHLVKTHSDWLDDQWPDPITGRPRLIFTTPTGRNYHGPAWTGNDLFPALRHIVFDDWEPHTPPPPPPRNTPPPTTRQHTRTHAKHTRRQQERLRNRRKSEENPPPF